MTPEDQFTEQLFKERAGEIAGYTFDLGRVGLPRHCAGLIMDIYLRFDDNTSSHVRVEHKPHAEPPPLPWWKQNFPQWWQWTSGIALAMLTLQAVGILGPPVHQLGGVVFYLLMGMYLGAGGVGCIIREVENRFKARRKQQAREFAERNLKTGRSE